MTKLRRNIFILLSVLLIFVMVAQNRLFGSSQTMSNGTYIVREYESKIAVFTEGENEPLTVFDVCICSLPQAEQNELSRGIEAENSDELQRLIEALTS